MCLFSNGLQFDPSKPLQTRAGRRNRWNALARRPTGSKKTAKLIPVSIGRKSPRSARKELFWFMAPALDAGGLANGWIRRPASVHPLQKTRASPCRGMIPWPAEGRTAWDPMLKTKGFAAGSRWLSEAIPPVTDPHHPPHPGGVPAQSRPRCWHPCRDAGVHVRAVPRWCRCFAPRPPDTRWEGFGFLADGRGGLVG